MAERLAVDGDELGHFIKLLKKSTDSLKGLRKALSDATVTGLGTDNLDSACEDFQNDWKYGAEQIGEQTDERAAEWFERGAGITSHLVWLVRPTAAAFDRADAA
ncbi:hypothetical protein [Streptomyces sp. 8N616]|uniref:hypothetical protein n=1 Tax=Streptomyces sp. 8N616 TaxID=3457414 RepID=UPI003FD40930